MQTSGECIQPIMMDRLKLISLNKESNRSRLEPSTWNLIRKLQINKKLRGSRGQGQKREALKGGPGVRCENLVGINIHNTFVKKGRDKIYKLATINVQSLKPKVEWIKKIVKDEDLDVVIVTETWLGDSECDDVWVNACELNKNGLKFKNVGRSDRSGGGIGVIYKEVLDVEVLEKYKGTTMYSITCKITTKSMSENNQFYVVGIYHPPTSKVNRYTNNQFTDEMGVKMEDWLNLGRDVMFLGDINIHVNDPEDADAFVYQEMLGALGLKQLVSFATHKEGNTLDHIIVNDMSALKPINIRKGEFVSDHCAVFVNLRRPKDIRKREYIEVNKIDDDQFQVVVDAVATTLNAEVGKNTSVEEKAELMDRVIRSESAKLTESISKLTTVRKKVPWYTPEIKHHKHILRQAEKRWKKHKTSENWQEYKSVRNSYKYLLKREKSKCYSEKFAECKGNQKKVYALVNNLLGTNADNPMPESESDEVLANEFADFFIGKIRKIRDNLDTVNLYEPTPVEGNILDKFQPIDEKTLAKHLSRVASKSCELDPIKTDHFKIIASKCLPFICELVNQSLEESTFALSWKSAIVRPLIKKLGMDLVMKSYRPVSNLSFISKVMESIIMEQVNNHTSEMLPAYQSVYRKGFSCETAVIHLVSCLLEEMEYGKVTNLCAIDLSAAFDTVDHEVLLAVLRSRFNITHDALALIDSYLRPRNFKVNVAKEYSKEIAFDFSVPQGSIAGPQLFTMYSSTLEDVVVSDHSINLHGFADDHALRNSFDPNEEYGEEASLDRMQECLASTKVWMGENRLQMNSSKTEFIQVGSRQKMKQCKSDHIALDTGNVEKVDVIRYLGAWVDSALKFDVHVTKKCRAASIGLYKIRLLRNSIDEDTCKSLVHAMVISHLDYCNGMLMGISERNIHKMQILQNRAAKLVLRKRKYDSATECLEQLHWLPVKSRIKFKILTLVYRAVNDTGPDYLKELIVPMQITRPGLRSSSKKGVMLQVPNTKHKTFSDRGFNVVGPKLWNSLPGYIKESESLHEFKKSLKTYLFEEHFY